MDIDQGSGRTHATSTISSVEQPSPLSGEAARQEGTILSEQEVVINGILIARITTSHFEESQAVKLRPTPKSFTVRDTNGQKLVTAEVDGHVEVEGVEFNGITMEMKRAICYSGDNHAAFQAQESCEMAAAIANLPASKIEQIRKSDQLGRHVTIAINKNEYWFVVLEFSADWADYIRGKQAPFSLASAREYGP
ncbi:hypothetical protein F4810DRAFT_710995 [Camillea tinctor]|nr:hypothetical protein F4810DRAFT_710995 [Camillea tinctor]